MNRMEEYKVLLQELEEMVPDLDRTIEKAQRRRFCKRLVWRTVTGFAAVFALFVVLVNFSAPVANACDQIPILRRLAEAVTFSKSLSDAVNHEYVQVMDLSQTDGDMTATVEYLIVDEKKVYIFFRVDVDEDMQMIFGGDIQYKFIPPSDGSRYFKPEQNGFYELSWFHFTEMENGLRMLTLDFDNPYRYDAPRKLTLNLKVYPIDETQIEYFWQLENLGDPAAVFSFELEFDVQKIAPARIITMNQPLEIDGQAFTVEKVEIYPTYMHVLLSEDPNNTKHLYGLKFYVESTDGMQFEQSGRGTGGPWESNLSYELTSPYFYDVAKMDLVVTGAVWTDKEKQSAYVDLAAERAEGLPQGWSMVSVVQQDGERLLIIRVAEIDHSVELDYKAYDLEGREWHMQGTFEQGEENSAGEITYHDRIIRLKDYPYDALWLSFKHISQWTAETPIRIPIE